ncbi:MAG: carboxylating nicotinate-nucleotide diphosphorylase [Acidobacteria bacterium]|nr:MAG: carboxylating nicotinate-nucleotide diphosphorylase [Acidobacteriota bacterium]
MPIPQLPPLLYEGLVRDALREDLGRAGDLTSDAVVPAGLVVDGAIRARRGGRIAGVEVAAAAFRQLDPDAALSIAAGDGSDVGAGGVVLAVRGRGRALLAAERVALNFLGHLSGIATVTRDVVARLAGSGARVACTRKTTPLLRALEKHAVRCGGGVNHRFGLDDAVLIKDNHRAIAGSARDALARVRRAVGHLVKIEVEIDDLAELEPLLEAGVDAVLLDNMSPDELRRAVAINRGRAILEASGGITPETAPAIAASGVDLLSIGWLTHSAPVLDLGFDLELPAAG